MSQSVRHALRTSASRECCEWYVDYAVPEQLVWLLRQARLGARPSVLVVTGSHRENGDSAKFMTAGGFRELLTTTGRSLRRLVMVATRGLSLDEAVALVSDSCTGLQSLSLQSLATHEDDVLTGAHHVRARMYRDHASRLPVTLRTLKLEGIGSVYSPVPCCASVWLSRLCALETLELSDSVVLDAEDWQALAQVPELCIHTGSNLNPTTAVPGLRYLWISGYTQWTDLAYFVGLEFLGLRSCDLGSPSHPSVGAWATIGRLPRLKRLSIQNCHGLRSDDLRLLPPSLRRLVLTDSPMADIETAPSSTPSGPSRAMIRRLILRVPTESPEMQALAVLFPGLKHLTCLPLSRAREPPPDYGQLLKLFPRLLIVDNGISNNQ